MCLSEVARVVDVDTATGDGVVEVEGRTRAASMAVLVLEGRPVRPGDWVLLHAGLATTVVDPDEATALAELHRAAHGAGADAPPGEEAR